VNKFKDPEYVRAAGNRPVVYWFDAKNLGDPGVGFGSSWASELQYLRDQTRGQLDSSGQPMGDPIIIDVNHNDGGGGQTYDLDGLASYGPAGASPGPGAHCWGAQASVDIANVNQVGDLLVVPSPTPVNDPRPRDEDPTYPFEGDYGYWSQAPTYGQWQSHVQFLYDWAINNPTKTTDPALLLIYAWDELDEGGGGIVPTNQEQFKYLDAIKSVKTGAYPSTYADTYNGDNCSIIRAGTWVRYFAPGAAAYDDDVQYSVTPGDTASLTSSNTTRFTVRFSVGPNRGKVDIKIDGSVVASNVDLYAVAYQWWNWESATLSSGAPHTVEIVVRSDTSSGDYYVPIDFIRAQVETGTAPTTSFVTSVTTNGQIRSNFTGPVGMSITVGSSPITVRELGRYFLAGNSKTHTLSITRADGQLMGSAPIDMSSGSADALGFKYSVLPTPVTLAANTTYYITSSEVAGPSEDTWYGETVLPQVGTTGVGVVNSGVYQWEGTWYPYPASGGQGNTYVPVNFKYS
jgi:hypothetical protein